MDVKGKGGVRLSVRTQGQGSQPVVFVHGWMMSGRVWDDLLPHLHSEGLQLVVPDQRGTGESDRPESGYRVEDYGEDLIALLDNIDVAQATLIGHSMGGQIVQWVAARYPDRVRAIAALAPVPASGTQLPDEVVQLFRNSAGSREKQKQILDVACKQLTADAQKRLLDDSVRIPEACIQQAFDAWTTGGFAGDLSRIKAPALVVASDDPFLSPSLLSETVVGPIERARLAYLPGPGHYVQVERPQETAAVLDAFLAGLG